MIKLYTAVYVKCKGAKIRSTFSSLSDELHNPATEMWIEDVDASVVKRS